MDGVGGARAAAVGEGLGSSTLGKAHGGQVEQRLVPLLPLPPPAWNPPPPPSLAASWEAPVLGPEKGVCTQHVPSAPFSGLLSQTLLQALDRPGVQPAMPLQSPSQRLQGPPAGEPCALQPLLTTPVTPPVTPKCPVSQS